jgi:DNA-binding NtrC family response regulator
MTGQLLVVDDDYLTRNAVSLFLSQEGYEVTSVPNGIEAEKRLSVESFDLVLSDFNMPGMDGLSLAKHIHRVAPQTAIIIMSGSADIKPKHVVAAGGIDFIEKPIIFEKLLARIELAFATGGPHKESRFELEGRDFIG